MSNSRSNGTALQAENNGHPATDKWINPPGGACKICEHKGTWCQESSDGEVADCRRVSVGAFKSETDAGGTWHHFHRLKGDAPTADDRPTVEEPGRVGRADSDTCHAVYSGLLEGLPITSAHRKALQARGFTDEEIGRLGYGSKPDAKIGDLMKRLYGRFGDAILTVPGFIKDRGGKLNLSCLPGLLIPARDIFGRIVGMKSRPDIPKADGPKYLWLSSARHGGPKAPSAAHIPLGVVGPIEVVRITEGELKADLATILSGVATISAPGVSNWKPALATAQVLGARTLRIAYDADWRTNAEVAKYTVALAKAAKKADLVVELEDWDLEAGKGIDDVLAAGGTTRVIAGGDVEKALDAIEEQAGGHPNSPIPDPSSNGDGKYHGDPLTPALALCNNTDMGNADRLVTRHGKSIRYCHPWGKWLSWDGRRWALDNTAAVNRLAMETVKLIPAEAGFLADKEAKRDRLEWHIKSEGRERLNAMLGVAAAWEGVPILPDQLDSDPWLFNVQNGTVDLRTGELRPHRREDLITCLAPVEFNKYAKCSTWITILDRIFDRRTELIQFFKRLCGLALTGVVTEQILPILWGTGANGKSTLLGAILEMMGEDYAMMAPPGLLVMKHGETHPTERAALFGKRLVVDMESAEGARLNEAWVKQLTGSDKISARRMREDFWTFTPTHKIMMGTNHRPEIRETKHAIWRRVKLVPFTVTIPENEQIRDLPQRLRAEYPGILAWAVRGCLDWQRDGLKPPADVVEATNEYRAEQDALAEFIAAECVISSQLSARATPLYDRYRQWAGTDAVTQRAFGRAMSERGFERYTDNGTRYRGLGLRSNGSDANGVPY